jgi:hypothetical protein
LKCYFCENNKIIIFINNGQINHKIRMKKKDMNLIMAAVGVLVMFKTMLHTAFRNIDEEFEEDFEAEVEEGEEETPYGVSDEEFEYFNEIFEDDDIDIESLKLDDSEDLNFKKLFTDLESNLQFKIAVMKNSAVLKEMILNRKRELDEIGEAVSDE